MFDLEALDRGECETAERCRFLARRTIARGRDARLGIGVENNLKELHVVTLRADLEHASKGPCGDRSVSALRLTLRRGLWRGNTRSTSKEFIELRTCSGSESSKPIVAFLCNTLLHLEGLDCSTCESSEVSSRIDAQKLLKTRNVSMFRALFQKNSEARGG